MSRCQHDAKCLSVAARVTHELTVKTSDKVLRRRPGFDIIKDTIGKVGVAVMDIDTWGYFIFMDEQEKKQNQQQEEEENDEDDE